MARGTTIRVAVAVGLALAGQLASMTATERSAGKMVQAAQAFLGGLTPEQRVQAVFEYASSERRRWHFIPNEMFPRKGVAFRTMTPAQRDLAHALLKTGLSQKGYATASAIIQLEDVLRAIENSTRFARSPLDYQFTIFGTPGATGSWAWRVEGHHLSLHFAVSGGRVVSTSPTFTGANPADVKEGPQKGLRVLAPLEDLGRAVVDSLTEPQRATAIVAPTAPNDIVSGNKNDIAPLTPAGIALAELSAPQRDGLMRLVQAYTAMMADDLAAERTSRLTAAGLDRITFAWSGPTTKGAKHYYRVQGPTFLIEYDNTQNDGNHIHAVWRDFQGDFGRDVLRDHLERDHAR
jgi:Protein of unknown function (DUF3500)